MAYLKVLPQYLSLVELKEQLKPFPLGQESNCRLCRHEAEVLNA